MIAAKNNLLENDLIHERRQERAATRQRPR